ncbi:MAG: hypothetical protein MUE72_11175 [Chitinophagaceae bacterium]|nr:hypothetical protein [Chitinophagaceae bacterium]
MTNNQSEEFHFLNLKSLHFWLIFFAPLMLFTILGFLRFFSILKELVHLHGSIFNTIAWSILGLQFLFLLLGKKIAKLCKVKTHIILSNEGISIKTDSSLLFKEKHIEINKSDLNYFLITEIQQNIKLVYTLAFKLSYSDKIYNATITLNENEKIFINRFISYLKSIPATSTNSEFYFRESWMAKKITKKFLAIFSSVIVITFFFLLFTLKKKPAAFSPLLSLGLVMKLYGSAKELSILNEKIERGEILFE